MKVDLELIQDAVLQVFADLEVSAGGHLSMDSLRAEWPRMRLRRSDLVQGVRELIFAGHLELDEDGSGALLILTPQGQERLHTRVPAPRSGMWALLSAKKQRPEPLRERHASASSTRFGRRRSDDTQVG